MSPFPHDTIAALSGVEITSLALAVSGVVILLLARFVAGGETITHRSYGKLYSGAPGANVEEKPEAR